MTSSTLELARPDVELSPVVITDDQVDVIRETVCKDATPAEMALYFFDCKRRGIHPLDRLLHFTKRQGKYTPVVSIDLLRSRAALTGQHMGTSDPAFAYVGNDGNQPTAAQVTVCRLVHGERCEFTATARWAEYKPDQDFMWRKMPHTMLGKCAEALALRKAFPQELGGLYVVEELEQAEESPAQPTVKSAQRKSEQPATNSQPANGQPQTDKPAAQPSTQGSTSAPAQKVGKVTGVLEQKTQSGKVFFYVTLNTGYRCQTWSPTLREAADRHHKAGDVVEITSAPQEGGWSDKLQGFKVVHAAGAQS